MSMLTDEPPPARYDLTRMHAAVLRHLDSLGFATSVHRMGDYCELHAVTLPAGTSMWDMTGDSQIERQMPAVQKLMAVNRGGPWKPSSSPPTSK